jgi:hypothetical protein
VPFLQHDQSKRNTLLQPPTTAEIRFKPRKLLAYLLAFYETTPKIIQLLQLFVKILRFPQAHHSNFRRRSEPPQKGGFLLVYRLNQPFFLDWYSPPTVESQQICWSLCWSDAKDQQQETNKMALTDLKIKTAKPAGSIVKLSDGGLQLWITPAGGKLWKLAYRMDTHEKTIQ